MTLLDEPAAQVLPDLPGFVAALAEHERQAAMLALQLHSIERSGLWGLDGSVTVGAWLRDRCRMSRRDANALVRRARVLGEYDSFAFAAVTGVLSAGQVEALSRLHSPKHAHLLAEQQAALVEIVAELTVADTEAACRRWRDNAADEVAGEPAAEPDRHLSLSRASDGVLLGNFALSDAAAVEVETAVRIASSYDGADDTRTQGERGADAIAEICAFFNKNHDDDGTPRNLPHVSISVDASTLAADRPEGVVADTHEPISPQCTDAYLCDCKIHTILRGPQGELLSYGDTTYTVPRKLFAQVAERDGGCRFPGCDRPVRFTEAHHVRYWRHGGGTDFKNLALLCSRHHHYVHRTNLQLVLDDRWRLHVYWSDGRHRVSTPRGAPPKHRRSPA
jgi:hypothetical protein